MKKKVFIGFSGGVDSAISAHLLKSKYDVTAVMFSNISNPNCTRPLEENAKQVASYLNVQLRIVDFTEDFYSLVINPFINSHRKGYTPNPCVTCNIDFKFGQFANWCFENGADLISTGHYCRTKDGRLYRGKDLSKDQSYFLNGLSSKILEKTVFPIGNLTKARVRRIARRINIPNSSRGDSQEICFIDTSLKTYLEKYIESKSGDIVDIDTNEVIGEHDGIYSLTLGQRKGLMIGGSDLPFYVANKDMTSNTIYVAKGKFNPNLWKNVFKMSKFNLINEANRGLKNGLSAKVRYGSRDISCTLDWETNIVELKDKVWTPSIGQSLVIYKGKECIGGGIIEEIRQ